SERIVERTSRALVRVSFDDESRVRSLCVQAAFPTDAWGARRRIAEKPDAIANLPPGPACVANRRLDLNRYEAAIGAMEHAEYLCHGQDWGVERCMEQYGDWIVRKRVGWTRPFLFVAPEIAHPPELSAIGTVSRCWRTAKRDFEPQAACIQSEGWEQ